MWKFEGACIFVAFHYMVSGITTVGPTVHRRCFEPAEPRLYRGEIPSQSVFFFKRSRFRKETLAPCVPALPRTVRMCSPKQISCSTKSVNNVANLNAGYQASPYKASVPVCLRRPRSSCFEPPCARLHRTGNNKRSERTEKRRTCNGVRHLTHRPYNSEDPCSYHHSRVPRGGILLQPRNHMVVTVRRSLPPAPAFVPRTIFLPGAFEHSQASLPGGTRGRRVVSGASVPPRPAKEVEMATRRSTRARRRVPRAAVLPRPLENVEEPRPGGKLTGVIGAAVLTSPGPFQDIEMAIL